MPITPKSIAKRRRHTCAKGLFHGEFTHSRATQPVSILLNRRPGKTIHYLPIASGPMSIAAVLNGKSYAVHADHLNTPRRLTRNNGHVVWQWAYSAFGEEQPTLAKNRFANPETTPNAGTTNAPEVVFNLRYPGQYFDKETGLFYNYFRTYQPGTGRYTQGDPIGLGGGWNRYSYVQGNPVSKVDPRGLATQAQVNAAITILRQSYPEIFPNAPNSVTGVPGLSGTLGQMLAGKTDLSGNIQYNADLYGANGVSIPQNQVENFFQTIAHEYQHTNESLMDRYGLSAGQLLDRFFPGRNLSIEDQIDRNADIMYGLGIGKFKMAIDCKN